MPAPRQPPDDNPFRQNSPRNVVSRARERWQLVRHWLIRHEPKGEKSSQPPEESSKG